MATHVEEHTRPGAHTDEPPVVVGSRYGIGVQQVVITDSALFFAQRTPRDQIAEACALDAATGQLLWHALPTTDLGMVTPAVAPERSAVSKTSV